MLHLPVLHIIIVILFICFFETRSLYYIVLDVLGTCYVDQVGPELSELHLSLLLRN